MGVNEPSGGDDAHTEGDSPELHILRKDELQGRTIDVPLGGMLYVNGRDVKLLSSTRVEITGPSYTQAQATILEDALASTEDGTRIELRQGTSCWIQITNTFLDT